MVSGLVSSVPIKNNYKCCKVTKNFFKREVIYVKNALKLKKYSFLWRYYRFFRYLCCVFPYEFKKYIYNKVYINN